MKDTNILQQSAKKGNAREAKVGEILYLLEYYCDYDCTCNFLGIVLPSVAVAANQDKRVQTFANVTQKCPKTLIRWWTWGLKKTKTLMKVSEHWCPEFGRSIYSAVIQLFYFLLTINFRFLTSFPPILRCISKYFSVICINISWINKLISHT